MPEYWKYARGSEWRKWDLHIHTPLSICQNYGGEINWDKFILSLERLPKDVTVIGINDYYFINGFEKVLEYKNIGRLNNIEKIFPILEFRIDTFGSGNENNLQKINLHILFDVDNDNYSSDINKIKKEFIEQIPITKLEKHQTKKLSTENFISEGGDLQTGFANLIPSTDHVFKLIKSSAWKDKTFLFLGYKEWSNLDKNNQLRIFKEDLYNKVWAFFTSNIDTIEASQQWLNEFGHKRLLYSGDIHGFDFLDTANKDKNDNFLPSVNYHCYTWIKADPTFNGLKQILYEPYERVKIQDTRPEEKASYYVIDKVSLSENKFWNSTINLNPNLNVIIGGRSTGKSTLLTSIAQKIGTINIEDEDQDNFVRNHISGVSVSWQDGSSEVNRDSQFFPQNYMYKIAKEKDLADKLIRDIIISKDKVNNLTGYEAFSNTNRTEIINIVNNLFLLQTDIENKQNENKTIGDKEGVAKEIAHLEKTIQEININTKISKDELNDYENILREIAINNNELQLLLNDKTNINIIKDKDIINSSIEYDFNSLSDSSRLLISDVYKKFSIESNQKWKNLLNDILISFNTKITELELYLSNIEKNEKYIKGQEFSKTNKQYQELQNRLKSEREKYAIIEEKEKNISLIVTQRDDLLNKIIELHEKYYINANKLTEVLTMQHEEIEIKPYIIFNEEKLKEFLSIRLNQKGFERQKFLSEFVSLYGANIKNTTTEFLLKALNNQIDYKSGYENNNVTSELLSTNWFSITYDLKYQNDRFNDMSQGKKAFVILKLLLEFSDKKCPILIDQPEDSLDNRAIYTELVQYLLQKKKERQIIIVTHNPNVVVGADAEQIIVANQNGKDSKNRDDIKFQYVCAGLEYSKIKDENKKIILESQGVREHVCEILEGGTDAFKKREKKYNLKE